jgi:hypothetical protein
VQGELSRLREGPGNDHVRDNLSLVSVVVPATDAVDGTAKLCTTGGTKLDGEPTGDRNRPAFNPVAVGTSADLRKVSGVGERIRTLRTHGLLSRSRESGWLGF